MRSKPLSSKQTKVLGYLHTFVLLFAIITNMLIFILRYIREESEGNLKGIMGYTEEDVVSTDLIGDSRYKLLIYY